MAALSTAIIIGAGIAAGSQVGGAIVASKANKKAAELQAGSTDKALEEQKRQYEQTRADTERMYQQQRTDEAPYLGLGAGAVGALQYGLGLTPPATKPVAPQPTLPGAPIPGPTTPPVRPTGPPQGALGRFAGGPQGSGLPPGSTGTGVPMRAPNGQMKSVPPDQVAHYTEMGAQVV